MHSLIADKDGDSIGDSDDPLERMLAVLRFWFTKDLVGILLVPHCQRLLMDGPRNMLKASLANHTTRF
jgi:hypothetical protein